ncbi:MAG: AzlC family ABC transporter permease [Oscillospiraceae bacterium]|nr:AzlC family ABC transporter permease [Oscillospiraceae bacterium]
MHKKALKTVFLDTVPVMTGYLFLGISFGILLQEAGYGLPWAFSMALFMYAGSAQFLSVSLLANHASILSSAIAVFLLNARHIFYGISLIDAYKDTGKKKPYLIFALTDETYSLVTQNQPPEGMKRHTYCFLVSLFDHIYWVAGCVIGSVAGNFIPISFEGIEFVLTALFVTLFTEQWLSNKNHFPAVVGVVSTVLCLVIFGKDIFLIPSMVLIAVLITTTRKTGKRKEDEVNA